jgi:hypothetical protein
MGWQYLAEGMSSVVFSHSDKDGPFAKVCF